MTYPDRSVVAESMDEHIISLATTNMPDKLINEWLGLNGLNPADLAATEITVKDRTITVTEFVRIHTENHPPAKMRDPRGGGYLKRHRTIPMIVGPDDFLSEDPK